MKFSCGKISQYSCRRWDSTLKYIKWQNSFEYWKHLWYRLALKLGWLTDPKVLIKSSRRFLWSLLCRETFRISKQNLLSHHFPWQSSYMLFPNRWTNHFTQWQIVKLYFWKGTNETNLPTWKHQFHKCLIKKSTIGWIWFTYVSAA